MGHYRSLTNAGKSYEYRSRSGRYTNVTDNFFSTVVLTGEILLKDDSNDHNFTAVQRLRMAEGGHLISHHYCSFFYCFKKNIFENIFQILFLLLYLYTSYSLHTKKKKRKKGKENKL